MTKIRKMDESTACTLVDQLTPDIPVDVDGSYTGRPLATDYRTVTTTGPAGTLPEKRSKSGHSKSGFTGSMGCHVSCPPKEKPVQDADDL